MSGVDRATAERMNDLAEHVANGGTVSAWSRANGVSQSRGDQIWQRVKRERAGAGNVKRHPKEALILAALRETTDSAQTIADAFSVSRPLVCRIRDENGLKPREWRERPVPSDFVALAPTMTCNAAAIHWRCGHPTARKWAAATGVVFSTKPSAPSTGRPRNGNGSSAAPTPLRKPDGCMEDAIDAQRLLQSVAGGGWPCHRCNAAGAADPAGNFFKLGAIREPLTAAELIERANRKRAA